MKIVSTWMNLKEEDRNLVKGLALSACLMAAGATLICVAGSMMKVTDRPISAIETDSEDLIIQMLKGKTYRLVRSKE